MVVGVSSHCGSFLSIPFTWDFSMHQEWRTCCFWSRIKLSIPFTWDFSMHLYRRDEALMVVFITFNSLYLGFLHAPKRLKKKLESLESIFQFPLLGISPCTFPVEKELAEREWNFQFPLLGISPCTRPRFWLDSSIGACSHHDLRYVCSIIIET